MFSTFEKLAPGKNKTEIRRLFIELTERYSENHRYYHTWNHLEYGWKEYNTLFEKPLRPVEFFAWMYHDAVYNPQANDNEARSGVLFLKHNVILGFDVEKADEVIDLIHSTNPAHIGTSPINDMDLCILGADLTTYFGYVNNVRKEYGFVTDEIWRHGRPAILKEFIKRQDSLYVTREFAAKFTHSALRNMQAELDCLSSQY